ncbi:hypothetical protein [Tsukamurella paurometabola]|uniref:Uncharacterized protein n=1 Tax=Tsukamurella paurometabola TaxID=2061 RepID=A0A3P8MDA6_TSUPA|nr:hypothetical protein [Tsukamurella paurometabola]UEA81626.1 hypothetical protein LK411_14605 [Tsukamurella paurometabola]VDR38633.1 Uncharacterised protein [Tsukamurella paurometabola]
MSYQRWRIHWESPTIGFDVKDGPDTPERRAVELATFLSAVTTGSQWFVGVGSETGYQTAELPNSPEAAGKVLLDHFRAHRDRGIVHLECHGDYQCGLVYSDGKATVNDLSAIADPNGITAAVTQWYSIARKAWAVTESFAVSIEQREIQHARERSQLVSDIEVESLIRGKVPPPRPRLKTLSPVSTVGWLNTVRRADLKFPERLIHGIHWTPIESSEYGFLQLGEAPEDFTFEMAESVHQACGNPTLEEMRSALAALRA